jgi:hypothetical protein
MWSGRRSPPKAGDKLPANAKIVLGCERIR